jgi:hypothetical protein
MTGSRGAGRNRAAACQVGPCRGGGVEGVGKVCSEIVSGCGPGCSGPVSGGGWQQEPAVALNRSRDVHLQCHPKAFSNTSAPGGTADASSQLTCPPLPFALRFLGGRCCQTPA